MELAYRLAVEEIAAHPPDPRPRHRHHHAGGRSRRSRSLRRLVPPAHGRTSPSEKDRVAGPPYWGKYIFHDNNRDINYSQVTMRALPRVVPAVASAGDARPARVGAVPLHLQRARRRRTRSLDPILYGELPMFANFEMAQLTKYGMPGVWTHGFVDMWSPGYLAFMSSNHNGMIRMYETFGNGGATTMKRTRRATPTARRPDRRASGIGRCRPTRRSTWSMRNNTNYMQTGVLIGAAVRIGVPRGPARELLPQEPQQRRGRAEGGAVRLRHSGRPDGSDARRPAAVNLLQLQGIEVGRATRRDQADGRHVPGRLVRHQARPAVRPAREDPAREAELPRSGRCAPTTTPAGRWG